MLLIINLQVDKEKAKRSDPPIAYSKGTIRSIIQRANPDMQIAANVPSMVATVTGLTTLLSFNS